uniref:Uncharacterized protein n=1 Tax=uncultured marine virus TaxID=186617 RepID=A0A0F7L6I9_9VIRU|nr:hypothetical protein BJAB0868_00947 [uncultured marine virus]
MAMTHVQSVRLCETAHPVTLAASSRRTFAASRGASRSRSRPTGGSCAQTSSGTSRTRCRRA